MNLLILSFALLQPPVDGQSRAGHPEEISRFARPADNGGWIGYLIGGGSANRHKAQPPSACEGTWGWDYTGCWFRRRVDLGWWHGLRDQGGVGAYKTDGPKLIPE